MTVWRPPSIIKIKVLGLAWRGPDLLLFEVEDDAGRVTGVRPLGGGIEFGETREAALVREFQEELGCPITVAGPWHAFENLYSHEGATGHEFAFVANIRLGDPKLYEADTIAFSEADLIPCTALWMNPLALPPGVDLYPSGLLRLIRSGEIVPAG